MPTRRYARNPVPAGVGVGPRVAQFLRHWYADQPAKVLAYDLRISESKAKDLLNGISVTPHVEQLASMFGLPFVRFVFKDAAARAKDSADRLERLEREIAQIEKKFAGDALFQRAFGRMANHAGMASGLGRADAGLSRDDGGRGDAGREERHQAVPTSPGRGGTLAAHPGWALRVAPLLRWLTLRAA